MIFFIYTGGGPQISACGSIEENEFLMRIKITAKRMTSASTRRPEKKMIPKRPTLRKKPATTKKKEMVWSALSTEKETTSVVSPVKKK